MNLKHNIFAQFALLSIGVIAAFAIVAVFFLNGEGSEYFSLFQQYAEVMQSGRPILDEEPFSMPSIAENIRRHRWTDIAIIGVGFSLLYVALTTIVWSGWKNSQRTQDQLLADNENLVHSDVGIRKMAEERAAVAELGRIATSAPDINDIYEIFASRVGSLVPFSMLSVNLIDHIEGTFTTRYVSGNRVSHHLRGKKMPLAGTFVELLQNGRSAILFQPDDIEEVRETFPSLAPGYNHGFRSYLGVTLISGNRRIGTLQWQSNEPHAYSKSDFSLAEQIGSQIAGALANSQLHTDLERESRDREVLAEIGRIISSSLAIEDIYERFAASVRDLIPSDRIVINVIDTDAHTYKNIYLSGIDVVHQEIGNELPLAGTQNETVVNTNTSHLIQDEDVKVLLSAFPRLSDGVDAGMRAFLCVPLISDEQIIGTLNLRAFRSDAYSARHLSLAERVGTQIAGAISNAQLHAQLDVEAREREVLAEIGQVISSSLNIEEVYQQISDQVSRIIPFDRLSIAIINLETRTSHVAYAAGMDVEHRQLGTVIPFEGSLAGQVVESHAPVIMQDFSRDQIANEFPLLRAGYDSGIRSSLGVPLVHADVFVAVLQFRSRIDVAYEHRHTVLAQRIGDQIAGAIANSILNAERQLAEMALKEAEETYRVLVENANDSIILLRDGKVVYCNSALENLLGYSNDEMQTIDFANNIAPEHRELILGNDRQRLQGDNAPKQHTIDLLTREGFRIPMEVRPRIIEYRGQDATMIVMRDISERKQLEEQLFQAQKMESIGNLAGGVAHDFNNLLSAIIGFTQLANSQLAADERVNGHYLKQIEMAAERGAGLVRQLLAFSRRQITAPIVLSVNDQIEDLGKMLRRLIGEHVDLNLELSSDAGMVLVDPGQLDQVLTNLAVNARDAMPAGGRLTIQTESVTLGTESINLDPELLPGDYVIITVSDDGTGMTTDVAAQAFEPFFTTKGVGEGTGLGLSTCYGIVKQNHGHITLETQLGRGTTFKIYIPKSAESPESPAEPERDDN
ncbi:MAG: GAF domain-containing protein, partial [Chloroflexi bacterium]|nr:GAF domain-containing protein [Chloroflexota bacterium]